MSSNPPPPPPPAIAGPPPGWGPPPQPPAQKKSNAGIWILLVVLVVGGVGALVLLTSDGEERSGPGGGDAADDVSAPDDVVSAYFTALNDRDCQAMVQLTSSATWSASGDTMETAVAACEAEVASGTEEMPQIIVEGVEVVSQDDAAATVSVTAQADGSTETQEVLLVKESGQWKIDFYNMGSSASMESEPPPAAGS